MNRKGINPLIATLLLIVIAISLCFLSMGFLNVLLEPTLNSPAFTVNGKVLDTTQTCVLPIDTPILIKYTKFGISSSINIKYESFENSTKFAILYKPKDTYVYLNSRQGFSSTLEYVPFTPNSRYQFPELNLFYLSHTNTTLAVRFELR